MGGDGKGVEIGVKDGRGGWRSEGGGDWSEGWERESWWRWGGYG